MKRRQFLRSMASAACGILGSLFVPSRPWEIPLDDWRKKPGWVETVRIVRWCGKLDASEISGGAGEFQMPQL